MLRTPRALVLADATARDLLRRPGLALGCVALAAFVLVLPQLASRAVAEADALGRHLGLSTLLLAVTLAAGFASLAAARREGPLAAAPEWWVTPLSPLGYVAGRLVGILAVAAPLLALLAPLAGLPRAQAADASSLADAALVLAAALAQASLFASLALLLGAALPPQPAAVLFLAAFVAARLAPPPGSALEAVLLPDFARLDLTRDFAFGRPIAAASAFAALGGAALQSAALAAAAAWALTRRFR